MLWAIEKTILNEAGIKQKQKWKKHAVFPAKFFLHFGKGLLQEKIGEKNEVQNFVGFCYKIVLRAPPCPILLWDTISVSKKISREFGVPPATMYILRPATFLKIAQNFDQNGPKYASGIDFMSQNVARYGCNKKNK